MSNDLIYLDYAATTPLHPAVAEAMAPFLAPGLAGNFGNPSSLHSVGQAAKTAYSKALATMANALNAQPQEIILTSGATEANNLALLGLIETLKATHLAISAIEHPAVLEVAQFLAKKQGMTVTYLPVNDEGFVQAEVLEKLLQSENPPQVVSIMLANNEVGTVQNLPMLSQLCKQYGALLHTDATQALGRLPLDWSTLGADYLTLSAHKAYGPRGLGLLLCRNACPKPAPLLYGGGQQGGLRPGTQNVAAAVGFAKAMELAVAYQPAESHRLQGLTQLLAVKLQALAEETLKQPLQINGPLAWGDLTQRLPGNFNFSLPPVAGDAWVMQFDLRGVALSSGSACHSQSLVPSHVLLALGKSKAVAASSIRVSLGLWTTEADVARFLAVAQTLLPRLLKPPHPAN